MLHLPGGLTISDFLADYWQQRPLVMPGAVTLPAAIDGAGLAGLACDDDVESRIVLAPRVAGQWEVRYGPFSANDFARLPATDWTLLVQDVDKFVSEVAEMLRFFRFIPDWRIDDIMVSYAADGGSVGPHTDDYDVFLIQAEGRRRWQIHTRPVSEDDLFTGLDLRILRHFEAEQEWILEPGDMLYLPPGVAHRGVALGPCMTWSVGFRAPSAKELGAGWLEHRLAQRDDPRYRDPGLALSDHPGAIPPEAVAQARRLVDALLQDSDGDFARWFCAFTSEPKEHLAPLPQEPIDDSALRRALSAGKDLRRAAGARILFHRQGNEVCLAASGTLHRLPADLSALAGLLADEPELAADRLVPWLGSDSARKLILDLYNDGQLEFDDA